MHRFEMARLAPLCAAIAIAFGGNALAIPDTKDPNYAKTAVNWTPVHARTTVSPQLVQGSDGKYNLVYELILESSHKFPAQVTQVDVIDTATGRTIKSLSDKDLLGVITQRSGLASGTIPTGASAIVWVNLSFDKAEDAPANLTHKITYNTTSPLHKKTAQYSHSGAQTAVTPGNPVVVGSPLRGDGWLALGGYAGVAGHRRALLAVDGKDTCAQRYAIDWIRLDKDNYASKGEKTANESSPAYAQPIYAVADGTIYSALDVFENQVPFTTTGDERYTHPAGNSIVQSIGNGLYGMYAHLKPGSIKVKAGDTVKKGDVIALLGNTGNSGAPHLHFHVVDDPSILGGNGVPYVFEKFELVGDIGPIDPFMKKYEKSQQQTVGEVPGKGTHENQLVKEGHLVNF